MKENVKRHIELIASRFELLDHLTAVMPRANLVAAVGKAYALFSRFLAKSVKYYSMNKFSMSFPSSASNVGLTLRSEATWRAFSKPWKVDLQGLVDEIEQTFVQVKDISQYHSFLEGHANLEITRETLHYSKENKIAHEQSLARLSQLESMMETVHATIIRFSKEQDVHQTANFLRQCVDEELQEPEHKSRHGSAQKQSLGQFSREGKDSLSSFDLPRTQEMGPPMMHRPIWTLYAMNSSLNFATSTMISCAVKRLSSKRQKCAGTDRNRETC